MLNKSLLIACLATIMVSCGGDNSNKIEEQEGIVTSTLSSDPKSPEELKRMEEESIKRQKEYEASLTTIDFNVDTLDFGNVLPGSDNTLAFTITNTGKAPLMIDDVSASCGCTTPEAPEEPIMPGQSDNIDVTFSPKPNQKEEIHKTVIVTANTKEKVHTVVIRAFVTQ